MFNSKFSRRNFLKSMAAASAVPALGSLSNVSFAANGQADHTIINVYLRGAMDSLSALIPYNEQAYFDARPTISIPAAGRLALSGNQQFALNKSLLPLRKLYNQGDLAFVVAAGLSDASVTRSHFAAQRRMESGSDNDKQMDGWLGRYLASKEDTGHVFRGVGMGREVQKSLKGFAPSLGISSLDSFKIQASGTNTGGVPDAITKLYEATNHSLLTDQVSQTLKALDVAESKGLGSTAKPDAYGTSAAGDALHQIAECVNANIGLEAANVDMGGWDFHSDMGNWSTGSQAGRFSDLGNILSAFYQEISANRNNVTIVVMTEFGRRVKENTSDGADHGKGSAMIVLGSGISGGKVYGNWPGLSPANLDRGDLKVTTDYRLVLAELVDRRLGRSDLLGDVFPNYSNDDYLGIFG